MKKQSTKHRDDDLRPEYDLTTLKGRVRGEYYKPAVAGTNRPSPAADTALDLSWTMTSR